MTLAEDSSLAPSERPELPDRPAFRRWLMRRLRPVIGWLLLLLGAISLFLGWWGVSGESLTAKQLPYLVSGGLTGVALILVAAVFLATDDFRRQMSRLHGLESKVDDLYALLVETPGDAAPSARSGRGGGAANPQSVVAVPTGTSYHRAVCPLAAGKPDAVPVSAAQIRRRRLRPCRVCAPDPLSAPR